MSLTLGISAERSFIELSQQAVPVVPSDVDEPPIGIPTALPLQELADKAPRLPRRRIKLGPDLSFAFSNDESATYFDQTQARTSLPEYRSATHPVALVVGESALASSLRYIPERTIIALDKSRDVCLFMQMYVSNLRSAGSLEEWKDRMGLNGQDKDGLEGQYMRHFNKLLKTQVTEWEYNGYPHALSSEEEFMHAQRLAREKVIIPWRADIGKRRHMKRLGRVLTRAEASITMVNISNVATYDQKHFSDGADCAEKLGYLPITPQAPILTTSAIPKIYDEALGEEVNADTILDALSEANIVIATGPFFGLENLASQGGSVYRDNPGPMFQPTSISSRDY
jgi:hypothetical protein